ncbi:MAG: hypothetical protein A3E01_20110 [Gammaproteobacteria bacterium RIFCSPHIGHO2_12_FULL_63_22]|nr:MAG: hypothetical protein A3E01_20110 [Gammaproteobacteria bacterium RIFCSPHIGHO2_12_FULL_63_22]
MTMGGPGHGAGTDRADDVILAHGDKALQLLGDTPGGAHWPNQADRLRRFEVMLDLLPDRLQPVVLCDLGCGTGELLAHIRALGLHNVSYVGVDRSALALEHAARKFPDARFVHLDVNAGDADLRAIECDYLVANGLFTAKWELSHEQMRGFMEQTLARVWPMARRGMAFNVMSKVVDWEREDLFHLGMDELAAFLHRLAGRRLTFRADYGLYEYTAYVLKDPGPPTPAESSARDELTDLVPAALLQQARHNHVYQQQFVKQLLLDKLSVPAAFDRYTRALDLPHARALVTKQLTPLRDAVRSHGIHFRELARAGDAFEVPPPRVIGPGNHRTLLGRTRSEFIGCLPDARVRSRSSVIELDEIIALDYEAGELSSIDDRLNLDPAIFQVDGETALMLPAGGNELALDEVFSLVGTHTWAFGHWLWEYLPRYVAATMAADLPAIPVLIDQGMPAQHRQALAALLPPGASIIELPPAGRARVARLWCAPTPMYMPLFEHMNERFRWDLLAAEPRRFARVVAEMNRRLGREDGAPGVRRIYLARRENRHRKLVNHAQIEALATRHGFDVVYPEDMDFAGQVRMARDAEWIVGPEGSAMFLAFFAAAGTRLCILNHPYTLGLPVLTGLLEEIGIDVTVMTGPAASSNAELPHFIDYRIDPEGFEAFLLAVLAR